MADIDKFDLLFLIHNVQVNKRPHGLRFKELMEICNCSPQGRKDPTRPAKCSYRTLITYLRELMAGNLLKKMIHAESGRPVYYVPRRQRRKVDGLRAKRDFLKFLDSLDARWFVPLRNLVKRIQKEKRDPYRIFNEHCFTFIDDEPIAFSKAEGSLEQIIALERRIRKRFSQDIRKFKENFYAREGIRRGEATPESRRAFLQARKQELGGSLGEYWRKLRKKAEDLPFPQRMWLAEGYSEKEIEQMLNDLERQRVHKKQD